jgi:hypothetical protein
VKWSKHLADDGESELVTVTMTGADVRDLLDYLDRLKPESDDSLEGPVAAELRDTLVYALEADPGVSGEHVPKRRR